MVLSRSKFHFIGIGGIGMSGLAELLHNMGATISGSDASENEQILKLKKLGATIYKGHHKENLSDADAVVYSSAIPSTNPELIEAKAKKIPIISRAEVLGEIMRLKRSIAVAGSHGKTTTTSMTASIFINAQVDPTVVVGGRLDLIKSNAFLGKGEWLIAEADESDGSFRRLSPEISIITNIDDDHMDHYKTFDNLQRAFKEFANLTPFYGFCVVMGDDVRTRKLFENFDKRIIFYGFHESNDFYLTKTGSNGGMQYTIHHDGNKLGTFQLKLPGEHNALNALSAFIVGYKCGIPSQKCIEGLEKFQGVDRRFQRLGDKNGVEIYDDYGHHPTEVKAVLKAFKEKFPKNKIKVAFQLHRYSRTQSCWSDFLKSFEDCDELYLVDIYPASEAPIEGITALKLSEEMKHKHCEYIGSVDNVLEKMLKAKPGEVFVTLGAGDIYKQGRKFLGI
jgi:UDP-N-acetylmuramate--alanine ligase